MIFKPLKQGEKQKPNVPVQMYKPMPPTRNIIAALSYMVNGCWTKDDIKLILEALGISEFYSQSLPLS